MGWLLIPLILFLAWRLYRQKKVAREPVSGSGGNRGQLQAGLDSPFYRLQERLSESVPPGAPGETAATWVERFLKAHGDPGARSLLRRILLLHYRQRFDPRGIGARDRSELKAQVDEWLEKPGRPEP